MCNWQKTCDHYYTSYSLSNTGTQSRACTEQSHPSPTNRPGHIEILVINCHLLITTTGRDRTASDHTTETKNERWYVAVPFKVVAYIPPCKLLMLLMAMMMLMPCCKYVVGRCVSLGLGGVISKGRAAPSTAVEVRASGRRVNRNTQEERY